MKMVILNIDTATEEAGVCLTQEGKVLAMRVNTEQKDHASWIHVAIQEVLRDTALHMRDISAVAVTAGPGSYTGLRVGMATAKGICYALRVPLITENTLKVMAFAAGEEFDKELTEKENVLFCPMIDARRMEVFAAMYDNELNEIMQPGAFVLDASSFKEALNKYTIIFFGSGSAKWKHLCTHPNACFAETNFVNVSHLGKMATGLYLKRIFADVAYENPVYLKEFYSYTKK